MHRSRIGVVLVDHPAASADRSLAFWSAVHGEPAVPADGPFHTIGVLDSVELAFQRLGHDTPARVHLDIETDDVRAEVERVVGLGATVVADHGEYCVLEDPGGVLFCVVPVQAAAEFERHARKRS